MNRSRAFDYAVLIGLIAFVLLGCVGGWLVAASPPDPYDPNDSPALDGFVIGLVGGGMWAILIGLGAHSFFTWLCDRSEERQAAPNNS